MSQYILAETAFRKAPEAQKYYYSEVFRKKLHCEVQTQGLRTAEPCHHRDDTFSAAMTLWEYFPENISKRPDLPPFAVKM
jgi:hypothetical protein